MLRVLYVPLEPADAEAGAARAWLAAANGIDARIAECGAPGALAAALDGPPPDLVWLHATTAPEADAPLPAELAAALAGRALLLTGGAAVLPARLGIETVPPNDVARRCWHHDDDELYLFRSFTEFPHIRGHAAFRRHPLFAGLGGGTYTWWPRNGEAYTTVTYRRPAWPARARVLAVERSYIHVNPDRATIWEYDLPDPASVGRILCIGAYLPFASPEPIFRRLLDRLAWNAVHYAAGAILPESGAPAAGAGGQADAADRGGPRRTGRPATTRTTGATGAAAVWRHHPPATREDPAMELPAPPSIEAPLPPFEPLLRLGGDAAEDRPFTLAGRRAFAAGGEARGIDEVWAHPLRVLRELRVAGSAAGEAAVTPVGVERRLDVGGRAVVERIVVPRELPGAIIEWTAADGADLELAWRIDLRLMWPYPAGALGPLRWRREGRLLLVRTAEPDDVAAFMLSEEPAAWAVEDASTEAAPSLRCRVRLRLAPGAGVRLAALATTEGDGGLAAALAALRSDAIVRGRAAAARRLRDRHLVLEAPDPRAGEAVEWAKHRLDGYLADTPGLGRSLVAGYWTSREGWNDGRPGYAWYFGRDAAWTALGSLAAGQFEAARDVIRFLGRHQDLSGKILHEATTSGMVHYDAADSTPLYLLLVARYLAWTGDLALLREEWPHVRRAYEFCLSTDSDGDDLIENPRVGHGWIEFGRLGGGTVTHYNAAIWTAALAELAAAAEAVGEAGQAAELKERATRARAALEAAFYDPAGRRYALNVRRAEDGGWVANPAQTAMQAVPLLLGAATPERAASWLDAVAGDGFTAPWGVRMIPASDPEYDPESYHGGAVWPLYTGWVSWAEFTAGRSEAAFRHWWMNVEQAFDRQRGAWDEVLHGLERRSVGVCPDQGWSTAMVVAPLVYGLLGAEPDATRHRLRLRPQIPAAWDRLTARRLRVGDAEVTLSFRRERDRHTFRVEQESGAVPLTLILEPLIPAARLAAVRIDGQPAELDARRHGERLLLPVQLVLDHERTIEIDTAVRDRRAPLELPVWPASPSND